MLHKTEDDMMTAPFDPCLTNQWKGAFNSLPHVEINIQAVYPFSTHECKNGKSRRFLVFSLF